LQASGLSAVVAPTGRAVQEVPKDQANGVDIGSTRQLFHDNFVFDLERSPNLRRTLNPPHRILRVPKPEQPWEALGFVFYARGQALPGFTKEDCEVIQDDGIDFEVRWKNGPDVSALAGRPVRVQVEMRNAKLYALRFVKGAA